MQALADFLTQLEAADPDLAAEHSISFFETDTPEALAALDTQLPIRCPAELKLLLGSSGGFSSDNFADVWNTISVYSAQALACNTVGLYDFIDEAWGGRPELALAISAEQQQALNHGYVVFGLRYADDNTHDYFYFDRAGQFHHLLFDQDDAAHNISQLQQLADSAASPPPSFESLAQLLQAQFALIIAELEQE